MMRVLALGLVVWLATTIIVEGVVFDRPRNWLGEKAKTNGVAHWFHELLTCHLCTGVWVGFALAIVAGGPFPEWWGVIVNGLLYKAVGHLILQLSMLAHWSSVRLRTPPRPMAQKIVVESPEPRRVRMMPGNDPEDAFRYAHGRDLGDATFETEGVRVKTSAGIMPREGAPTVGHAGE